MKEFIVGEAPAFTIQQMILDLMDLCYYDGARPYFNTNYHDSFTINGKFTAVISSTGKQVYTNLPVIIEEE